MNNAANNHRPVEEFSLPEDVAKLESQLRDFRPKQPENMELPEARRSRAISPSRKDRQFTWQAVCASWLVGVSIGAAAMYGANSLSPSIDSAGDARVSIVEEPSTPTSRKENSAALAQVDANAERAASSTEGAKESVRAGSSWLLSWLQRPSGESDESRDVLGVGSYRGPRASRSITTGSIVGSGASWKQSSFPVSSSSTSTHDTSVSEDDPRNQRQLMNELVGQLR